MKKSVFERFISKYNLAGAADAVLLTCDTSGISTKFISDDRNALGNISTTELVLDVGSYAIYDTAQLKLLLGVLDEDITVKVNKNKDNSKNVSISFNDKNVKTNFVLADEQNIPKVPDLKKLPTFHIIAPIDKVFADRFVKATGALKDVDTFTVTSDGKSTDITIGYSNRNTNRVSIGVPATKMEKIEPINFHAKYLREMLVANKESTSGQIEISSDGMARITFTIDNFTVTYYLPEIKSED